MMKALLMDMDGLMLDTERLAVRAWLEAGRRHGVALREADIIINIGRGAHETRAYLAALYPDSPFEAMYADRLRIAHEWLEQEPPALMPGLIQFLDDADRKGYKKCVATSTSPERARYALERAGIIGRFDALSCGGPGVPSKPHPDIFLNAAALLGARSDECTILEDSPHGVTAGIAAGMRVIMVPDIAPMPDALADGVVLCRNLPEAMRYI